MKKTIIISVISAIVAIILTIIFICLFFELKYPLKYEDDIELNATKNNLEASFVAAVINAESSFNKDAKSSSGAIGLMQLMPATAKYVAKKNSIEFCEKDLYDPQKNIQIGCLYLKYLFDKFNDEKTVLFAYNSGEGNVICWLKNSDFSVDGQKLVSCPYSETTNYVQAVEKSKKYYKKKLSA